MKYLVHTLGVDAFRTLVEVGEEIIVIGTFLLILCNG
jgi:hypothetical protein